MYDAAGNVSNTYPFELKCENLIQFPPERYSNYASITVEGGHGSIHHIDEPMQVCYSFPANNSGVGFNFNDYQPATLGSNGVDTSGSHQGMAHGSMASATNYCFNDTVTGPSGYEAFRLEVLFEGTLVDFAEVWIYVEP
jgi:hypothetical protein